MAAETNLTRIGIVSSVDPSGGKARVFFPTMGNMVSEWLYVLRFPNAVVKIKEDGKDKDLPVYDWFPAVNDRVVCLYLYGDNTDGFILGVIK